MSTEVERPCRFCGAPLTHTFVDLGMSPLANRYLTPEQLHQMEPFYPLHAYVCGECFLVQLEAFESPASLFDDYAYFASYSDTWVEHARAYAETVRTRFDLTAQSQVIEIASNDGYLLQHFLGMGIPVLGIEPAANVAEAALRKGIPTVIEFFGDALARKLLVSGPVADLVVANNVLAHVPALNEFVRAAGSLLKPGGVITMEFPHVLRLMEKREFDTIYHEHLCYFSLITVERIFGCHGLRLFDVDELPTHGGSLRIYACRTEDRRHRTERRVQTLRDLEEGAALRSLRPYLAFAAEVARTKRRLLRFLIEAREAGRSVAAYGAPAKGSTLLNYCGIGPDLVEYTVDRNPHKQGRFLPGVHLPIHAPERLGQTRPDYVLILPWNLKEEIMSQMAHVQAWGGRFVVPVPEVTVC